MTEASPTNLEDLRTAIDRIDNAVVDLLLERMAIVEAVGHRKRADPTNRLPVRPAREAQIIRRLVARAQDKFPPTALSRMWHELLAATSAAQQPFKIAVMASHPSIWDLARDQFGSMTPAERVETPQQALRQLADDNAQFAVLPTPSESEHWWRSFARQLNETPFRVIGRLPLVPANHHTIERSAVVIGNVPFEASGDDLTMVMIELTNEVSRTKLRDLLVAAGMTTTWLAAMRTESGVAVHLLEVSRFIGGSADALAKALAPLRDDLMTTMLLGGYPRPLTLSV